MTIGIIGLGVVGDAVRNGMELLGHRVRIHDIRLPDTTVRDVLQTELCFICVPTPCTAEGVCDVSIVESVLTELALHQYAGLAVIKSTISPGSTDQFAKQFKLRLAFCPEFLRERSAMSDFVERHDVCIIGAYDQESHDLIRRAHGNLPDHVFHLTPREAELAKYFSNVYNALRIVFANEFFEVCQALGADYSKIKQAMVHRYNIEDMYLECNENFRGFGGVCLPKDTQAFAALVRALGLDLKLFETVVEENKKFRRTIPQGMRDVA